MKWQNDERRTKNLAPHSRVLPLTGTILGGFPRQSNFEVHYFPKQIQADTFGGKCHNDSTKQFRSITISALPAVTRSF
ncbi:hypothetical protein [uncultured Gimesia sp.]|uniref:hypothetical protein n=1 Tax=uncultured Gimesia sp. TaxID=1678688 RepID=UPI0030D9D023